MSHVFSGTEFSDLTFAGFIEPAPGLVDRPLIAVVLAHLGNSAFLVQTNGWVWLVPLSM